ncbi:hypothetical protein Tco_1546584 [Tanacetum coccineum]
MRLPYWGIRGDISVTTFKNALKANYLSHSSKYAKIPFLATVRPWFSSIGYSGEIRAKGTLKKEDIIHKLNKKSREKVVPYPRFIYLILEYMMPEYENDTLTLNPTQVFSIHNWALDSNQLEGPLFTDHMLAICKANVPVKSKAPKTSSKAKKRVSQGKMPGAKTGLRRKQSSKHTSESKNEANKASIPVVIELHKEDQQAVGGPTYLEATSEDGAHPQLNSGCDASADSITKVDPGIYASNDSIPQQQGIDEGTQYYSLDHIFAGTNLSVLVDKTKFAGEGLKTAHTNLGTNVEPSSAEIFKTIKLEDLSKLMHDVKTDFMYLDSPEDEPIFVQDENEEIQKLEQLKNKAKAEFAFLTDQPAYPNVAQLTELLVNSIKPELSKLLSSYDFSSFIPSELKELSSKFTILSREVKELKKHVQGMEIELHGDLKEIPNKLETFTSTISSCEHIHFTTEKIEEQKRIEESLKAKLAKQEVEKVNNELVDLIGIDVVTKYYKNKLLYDKYCNKMLKRRKSSKNINCDVLTRRGPITLKVYREDGTTKVIPNCKTSDLHLAEWRDVVQACPNKEGKGLKTIYEQIKTRIDYLHHTKEELKIDFNKPLEEQDPLDEMNDLANKKRKRADDFHDYFRSTKKFKLSVRYEDHPAGTVLNEPVRGMILFNSFQRQDFVTIEDFEDLLNEMLYTVQEVFFRGRLLGSVPEPFSLSLDLNIKSPKYNSKLKTIQLESLKKLQLQFFRYLEYQDHLHFSLCGGLETEEDLSKSFSLAWLTIPS